jgi:hypothetical protein
MGSERFARNGHLDTLRRTVEQPRAQHLFQILNLARNRRLRDVDTLGSQAETLVLGNRQEVFKVS